MNSFVNKNKYFQQKVGELIREIREDKIKKSLNQHANEYELDKGTLSKIERGIYSNEFSTIWKIVETLDMDFSEFARLLKDKLGEGFKFIDE